MAKDDDKDIAALEKAVDDLTVKLEKAAKLGEENAQLQATIKELTAKAAKADADKAEVQKQLDAETAKAKMKDDMEEEERDFYEDLEDEDEKKKFLTASKADRKTVMDKKTKSDETVKFDGRIIRKSAVGEEQFAVFKSLSAGLTKAQEDLAKEQDLRKTAEFTKQVETDINNLPGTMVEKVAVLKSIAVMPEAERKTLDTMLKAGDKAISSAFTKIGVRNAGAAANGQSFEKRIAEVQARDKCTKAVAMQKARAEFPEEFKAYQGQN